VQSRSRPFRRIAGRRASPTHGQWERICGKKRDGSIVGAGDHIGAEIDTERVRQRIASREGMEALRNLDANPRRRGLLAALPTAA